jgi:hypothetical protein
MNAYNYHIAFLNMDIGSMQPEASIVTVDTTAAAALE